MGLGVSLGSFLPSVDEASPAVCKIKQTIIRCVARATNTTWGSTLLRANTTQGQNYLRPTLLGANTA